MGLEREVKKQTGFNVQYDLELQATTTFSKVV